MTLSQWASAFSRAGVWLRHANAAKRGQLPEHLARHLGYSLVARLMRRVFR